MEVFFYCLALSRGSLDERSRTILALYAVRCLSESYDIMQIKEEGCAGYISTQGKQVSFGGISGTLFEMKIENTRGVAEGVFIIRPAQLLLRQQMPVRDTRPQNIRGNPILN